MTESIIIDRASPRDIPGILELQEANLSESRSGLSVRQTADWFKRTRADMPLIVARLGDKIVGYTVATAQPEQTQLPIAQAMWRKFPAPPDCYSYGPVCVAENMRRKGLAGAMFVRLREELPGRPAMTFAPVENLSARMAFRKMAMQQLGMFTFGAIDYIAFRY